METEADHFLVSADLMYCENPILTEMTPVRIPLDVPERRLHDSLLAVEQYVLAQEEILIEELQHDLESTTNYPDHSENTA